MATPCHEHPLEERFTSESCRLCGHSIYETAYVCSTCNFHFHKFCVEAPPHIQRHPFHLLHDLSLVRDRKYGRFICKATDDCDFSLCTEDALSTLPDPDGSLQKEQITVPFHDHELTSFFARWTIGDRCLLCWGQIEGDGYICPQFSCRFLVHRRCTEDRYCEDGTKVLGVYHNHSLAITSEKHGKSILCWECETEILGERLGCAKCGCFYHRSCIVGLPELLRLHIHPDHLLVLFIYYHRFSSRECWSCSSSIYSGLFYRCIDCDFYLHTDCARRILLYCEEGESATRMVPWHGHPLLLCHIMDDATHRCSGCGDNVNGLAYRCKEKDCKVLLDKACIGLKSKMDHPHHPYPDHPLVLLTGDDWSRPRCDSCCEQIVGFGFSCEPCDFFLDVKCASRIPTHNAHLHEHNLTHFNAIPSLKCSRCGKPTDSPLFRCVPCDFNLHEECMKLPPTVTCAKHEDVLVLRDSYLENNDGEYYCDICEQRRDERLGVYVCERCKMDILFRAHMECVLPQLKGMFVNKWSRDLLAKRWDEKVAYHEEEVNALEKKLAEAKAELDRVRKKRDEVTKDTGGQEIPLGKSRLPLGREE